MSCIGKILLLDSFPAVGVCSEGWSGKMRKMKVIETLMSAQAEKMLSSVKPANFSTPRLLPPLPKPNFSQQNDWGQCALRGLRDLLHVISPDGRIHYVSTSCKLLVGYERTYLLGRVIHNFIHPDDVDVFCKELSEVMLCGISTRFIYRFWTRDNDWTILESQCNMYRDPNNVFDRSRLILMARPYFTKNGPRIDSFLEYKVGNEQLRQQLMQQLMQLKSEDSDTDSDCDAASTEAMDGELVDLDEGECVQQSDAACSSPERKPTNDATVSGS